MGICPTECAPFVDRLLATLRSKSYLPYSDAVAPAPIRPYEGPRGKKRPLEQDDQEWARDRDSRLHQKDLDLTKTDLIDVWGASAPE